MSDFVDGLEQDLVAAARRRAVAAPRVRRRPWRGLGGRSLLLAFGLLVAAAGSAAGGTLLVLRGSVIPGPAPVDAGPTLTPVAGSSRVLARRVADPASAAAWALRLARTGGGLICSTVGQEQDGAFGLVGLDGRFRKLAEGAVDGCGPERRGSTTVLGVRVFAARRRVDVRSVLYVVGSADLRAATLQTTAGARPIPLDDEHAGLAVLATYPEDLGLEVRLRYASGRVERRSLGRSPFVVTDPQGGPAYRTSARGGAGQRSCVSFATARYTGSVSAASPEVCGRLVGRPKGRTIGTGFFFAVRRVTRTPAGTLGRAWEIGPRTAVWGLLGDDVRELVVQVPGRADVRVARQPSRAAAVVLPGTTDPKEIRVTVHFTDARRTTLTGDQNLLPPGPRR